MTTLITEEPTVSTLHIEHAIADFDRWHAAFQRFEEVRAQPVCAPNEFNSQSTIRITSWSTSTSTP